MPLLLLAHAPEDGAIAGRFIIFDAITGVYGVPAGAIAVSNFPGNNY